MIVLLNLEEYVFAHGYLDLRSPLLKHACTIAISDSTTFELNGLRTLYFSSVTKEMSALYHA